MTRIDAADGSTHVNTLTGNVFFPDLLSGPVHDGLVVVFSAAALMMLVAAMASALRGGRYVHDYPLTA